MRLAIIADIHGNLQALEAVLADLERCAAECVVVNGDMVNRGPDSVAVMTRLLSQGYPLTLGNHDDLVRKWTDHADDIPADWFNDPFWKATAWTARQLEQAGLTDALRNLPMTCRVAPAGAPSLLISHGSPRHYREGYGKFLSDEDISEITRMHPADILIGSHTHRPMQRQWGHHQVLNTGAVGTPFNGDPRAQYLLMTLTNGTWRAEFRAVAYDREAALAAFDRDNYLPQGDLSALIFQEEVRYAQAIYTPFWMWTEQHQKARTWSSWTEFREAFADRFKLPELPLDPPKTPDRVGQTPERS